MSLENLADGIPFTVCHGSNGHSPILGDLQFRNAARMLLEADRSYNARFLLFRQCSILENRTYTHNCYKARLKPYTYVVLATKQIVVLRKWSDS